MSVIELSIRGAGAGDVGELIELLHEMADQQVRRMILDRIYEIMGA